MAAWQCLLMLITLNWQQHFWATVIWAVWRPIHGNLREIQWDYVPSRVGTRCGCWHWLWKPTVWENTANLCPKKSSSFHCSSVEHNLLRSALACCVEQAEPMILRDVTDRSNLDCRSGHFRSSNEQADHKYYITMKHKPWYWMCVYFKTSWMLTPLPPTCHAR